MKKGNFQWSEEAQIAFEQLKKAMTTTPVLAMPDFGKVFSIEVDASGLGLGAVLTQEGRPLAYLSKAISPKNLGLSTYEKEFLAILLAVSKWKHYLSPKPFVIKIDHESLKYLLEQRITTAIQQKGMMKLMGLEYIINYKKGKENLAADALSRRGFEEGSAQAISAVVPTLAKEISESYKDDPKVQHIITTLLLQPTQPTDYTYQQGMVKYKGRIYLGSGGDIKREMVDQMHASAVGGHSGIDNTYKRLKQVFYWPGMKSDVEKRVKKM